MHAWHYKSIWGVYQFLSVFSIALSVIILIKVSELLVHVCCLTLELFLGKSLNLLDVRELVCQEIDHVIFRCHKKSLWT